MHSLRLLIGNRNYSSWSLRAWLALRVSEIDFELERVSLYDVHWSERREDLSPSGLVPVLFHGGFAIWDSLAICEYVAERFDGALGWPADRMARARARSVSAQMHSGFHALRASMPMNCRRRVEGFRPPTAAQADIDAVRALWRDCLETWGGPWLFGAYSIADVMYAPVASRFQTYGVVLDAPESDYAALALEHPAMQEWLEAAAGETEIIDAAEVEA